MKITVGIDKGTSYLFSAATGLLTINGLGNLTLENFLMVVNATRSVVLYNPFKSGLSGAVSGNTIDLQIDTSSMADSDDLLIFMNIEDQTENALALLRQIIRLLEPSASVDSYGRQRVTLDGAAQTVTIATTGGANVTGIGYPSAACSTAGGPINPYTLTASQPVQMISTVVDQRLEFEAQLAIAANTFKLALQRS